MSRSGKRAPEDDVIVAHGWRIYPHPALLEQLDALETQVIAQANPQGNAAKVLKWALEAMFDSIPADPTLKRYRQGRTLGKEYTGWFRDKYGGRFRLFFRYDAEDKTLVFAWINDEQTKRTRGAKNDAYAVFRKMLDEGYPPNSWDELLNAASNPQVIKRLREMQGRA